MDEIAYKAISKIEDEIEQLYNEAFPEEERYPFWAIIESAESDKVDFLGIYKNDQLVGFTYLIYYRDIVYVFYLAIKKSMRNQGLGSYVVKDLIARNPNKIVMLCIEQPDNELKKRRRAFYLRNGMHSTGKNLDNFGYKFEFLASKEGYAPVAEEIKGIYKTMTWSEHGGPEIRKTLEVDNIKIF